MNRLLIVARLKEGARAEAEALLAVGPPFDLAELGFDRHGVYLSPTEVAFFFEAPDVEWIVDEIVDDFRLARAFEAWQKLVERPRVARERFYWAREEVEE
jgi:hypothetical protein